MHELKLGAELLTERVSVCLSGGCRHKVVACPLLTSLSAAIKLICYQLADLQARADLTNVSSGNHAEIEAARKAAALRAYEADRDKVKERVAREKIVRQAQEKRAKEEAEAEKEAAKQREAEEANEALLRASGAQEEGESSKGGEGDVGGLLAPADTQGDFRLQSDSWGHGRRLG
jgi:hypothetical protein